MKKIIFIILILLFNCKFSDDLNGGRLKKKARRDDLLRCIIIMSIAEYGKRNSLSNSDVAKEQNLDMLVEYSTCTQKTDPYSFSIP